MCNKTRFIFPPATIPSLAGSCGILFVSFLLKSYETEFVVLVHYFSRNSPRKVLVAIRDRHPSADFYSSTRSGASLRHHQISFLWQDSQQKVNENQTVTSMRLTRLRVGETWHNKDGHESLEWIQINYGLFHILVLCEREGRGERR